MLKLGVKFILNQLNSTRPFVLTIAGHDPSGGAGLTADVKTFEQHKVYGFSVCTANTVQTENKFFAINWLNADLVIIQLETLLKEYPIEFFKIGIIENGELLLRVLDCIEKYSKKPFIIWDPILSASAGTGFHNSVEGIDEILSRVGLVTPNLKEAELLFGGNIPTSASVLLKGGHGVGENSNDLLFQEGEEQVLKGKRFSDFDKHGTGCILSAAILSNLALGLSVHEACLKGKEYLTKALISNSTLLAFHHSNG